MRILSLGLLFLTSCGTFGGGAGLELETVADQLVDYDVVFLGEQHDNQVLHVQHYALFRLLHARNPKLVLSLEMFERDVQETMDRYLRGEIDEATFLAEARPWPNYRRDYRRFVEFAKRQGLPVVAANAPKALTTAVRKGEADPDASYMPRVRYSPKDRYWEEFKGAMAEFHAEASEDEVFRYYQAQCMWDDSMAESIADALQVAEAGTQVVHICGKFHSDEGLGTVLRLSRLRDGVRSAVLTAESVPNVIRTGDGRFTLLVPPEPELPKVAKKAMDETAPEGGGAAPEHGGDPSAAPAPAPAPDLDDVTFGRPALGFMPDYQEGMDGLGVAEIVGDGPCDRAGIEPGDVILSVDGRDVVDVESYMQVLGDLTIGSTVKVEIARGADSSEIFEVVVGTRGH